MIAILLTAFACMALVAIAVKKAPVWKNDSNDCRGCTRCYDENEHMTFMQ